MGDVYIPAFDAEAEWRGSFAATLNPYLPPFSKKEGQLDEVMALACADNDFFALRRRPCDRLRDCFAAANLPWRPLFESRIENGSQPVLFAVTERSLALCKELGLSPTCPPLEVVRRVNSKIWSAIARERAGAGLGVIALSSSEVMAKATDLLRQGPVILKEAFGVSGSGNLIVASPNRLRTVARVLRSQEVRDRRIEIVVEPLLPKQADFSSHLMLTPSGQWKLLGFQAILNCQSRYLGSRQLAAEHRARIEASDLMRKLESIAEQLVEAGYFGPVCIDGLILVDGSVMPVLEVNARMSMGLLNLIFGQKLSKWGLASTLLKLRVGTKPDAPAPIDLLARAKLLPKRPGAGAILPITSNTSVNIDGTADLIVAVLYTDSHDEQSLWQNMYEAFALAGLDTIPRPSAT